MIGRENMGVSGIKNIRKRGDIRIKRECEKYMAA